MGHSLSFLSIARNVDVIRHHILFQPNCVAKSRKMSDGEHFAEFPLWANMDFSKDCKAYGNWLSTFLEPNPWNKSQYLDGDATLIVDYFTSSLPQNWTKPENWTHGDYASRVLEWYGWNLWTNYK